MATIKKIRRKKGIAYQISFSDPINKKTIRKIVWCSKKDAEKLKLQIETDIAFGRFNIENNNKIKISYKWSNLLKKYLEYCYANKSPITVKREICVFNAFEEFIKFDIELNNITNRVIETFRDYRMENRKPASVCLELRHLKIIFNMGRKWDYCKSNPVVGVKQPKIGKTKVKFLLKEEIQRLFKVIEKDNNIKFLNLVKAYLNTGARRKELLSPSFTWSDVNFKEQTILIQGKGSYIRYVPVNETLLKILKSNKNNGDKFPFEFNPSYVSHKIQDYYKLANIKDANLHTLRKTFGSLLMQNEAADIFTVSKLLGHSSVKTTEKYYVDLLPKNLMRSVSKLTEIM